MCKLFATVTEARLETISEQISNKYTDTFLLAAAILDSRLSMKTRLIKNTSAQAHLLLQEY